MTFRLPRRRSDSTPDALTVTQAPDGDLVVQLTDKAEIPQMRARLRDRLAERLADDDVDAVVAATTELVGRLCLVADPAVQVTISSDRPVRLRIRGTLRSSREEAMRHLTWDHRTFGGILVSQSVTDLGVDFDPFGVVSIRADVEVEAAAGSDR